MNVESKSYDIEFDQGRHWRAKLGFVLLATEQTVADDVYTLCPDGVGIHFTRVPIPDSITNETLLALAPDLEKAAALMLPDGTLDVVSYACTSGSLVVGEERVCELLNAGAPNAKASCIIMAVGRALMTQPKVLMLDEPTAGVSPIVMDELFDRIIEVARTGIPILMVEQNARQALEIADKAYVLVQGRNAHTGTGKELLADEEVRRSFLGG